MGAIERNERTRKPGFRLRKRLSPALACSSNVTRLSSQQIPSRQIDVGQGGSHEQAVGVLGQTAIAYLGKAKDALDDPDDMFDLGAHPRLGLVLAPLDWVNDTTLSVTAIDEVASARRARSDHLAFAAIRLVTPNPCLVAMQQHRQQCAVRNVRRTYG